MKKEDLRVLMRRCKGDADAVAFHHIFNQGKLTPEDQEFLDEHLPALGFDVMTLWLARDAEPPTPKRRIDRLVETWPTQNAEVQVKFTLAPRAVRFDPDAYEYLLEQVRDRTAPHLWWWLARSLKGMCPTFEHATKVEHAPELVAALFPHRRDERACRTEVLRLAREGGVVVRGPWWSLSSADGERPSPLQDRASVIFWMNEHQMLDERSRGDVLPDEVRFPCEQPDRLRGDDAQDYLLRLALRWPGKDPESARDWYIQQVLRAAHRGTDWARLLHDIVGAKGPILGGREAHMKGDDATRLVDDIAWRSFGSDVEAPWIGYAVGRALLRREPGAWEKAFQFLGRSDLHFPVSESQKAFPWARLVASIHGEEDDALGKPVPSLIPTWILLQAPLPEDADETFDDRLLSFRDAVHDGGDVTPIEWVARLAELPLTSARASRLLSMVLSSEHSLRLASQDLLNRLADAASLPVPCVPPPEVFFGGRSRIEPAKMMLYRKLAGDEGDPQIRRWMRAPLDGDPKELGSGPWNAADRMRSAPDLAPTELAQEIIERARGELVLDLVDFQKAFPDLITETLLLEVATARVSDVTERWVFSDKVELPEYLSALALQRCHVPIEAQELVALSRWLLDLGRDPRDILACLLDRSPRLDWDWQVQRLVLRILDGRSRWETFGPPIFRAMLDDGATGALWSLVDQITSDRNGEVPRGIVVAIHEALAIVLLELAASALEADDEAGAAPPLHSLVALHPPARLSARLKAMLPKTRPDGEARDLVELNLRLLRRSKTRDAQPTDVLGALQLLAEPRAA